MLNMVAVALAIVTFGVLTIPDLMTRGRKWHKAHELCAINDKYKEIKAAYWELAIVLVICQLIVLVAGSLLAAQLFPKSELSRLLPIFYGVSLVPCYQSVFALYYGVFPVSRWDDFLYSPIEGEIKRLARRILMAVGGYVGIVTVVSIAGLLFYRA